jgi:hypothetical protein
MVEAQEFLCPARTKSWILKVGGGGGTAEKAGGANCGGEQTWEAKPGEVSKGGKLLG